MIFAFKYRGVDIDSSKTQRYLKCKYIKIVLQLCISINVNLQPEQLITVLIASKLACEETWSINGQKQIRGYVLKKNVSVRTVCWLKLHNSN